MNLAHATQPIGKVHLGLRAMLPASQKWLKSWCRRQDLNPRPSVYKALAPAPISPELAVSRRSEHRLLPSKYGLAGVRRFTMHPRAKVVAQCPGPTSSDERIASGLR